MFTNRALKSTNHLLVENIIKLFFEFTVAMLKPNTGGENK
jgi:hypothetical protein